MLKEITEIGKIDHIGIAVTDLTKSINYYKNLLNFNLINEKSLIEHDIKVAFLKKFETSIELLQPITFKSFETGLLKEFTVNNFILKNKNDGIHHFCIQTQDIEKTAQMLSEKGIEKISNDEDWKGSDGSPICFFNTQNIFGYLLEIKQLI